MLLKKLMKDQKFLLSSGITVFGILIVLIKLIIVLSKTPLRQPSSNASPRKSNNSAAQVSSNSAVKVTSSIKPVTKYSLSGKNVQNILTKKNSDYWLLDASNSKESDSDSFSEIYLNAKPGDTIKVRSGVYELPENISKNNLKIIGLGSERVDVTFLNSNKKTIRVDVDEITFENVYIYDTGSMFYFFQIKSGKVNFKNVSLSGENNTTMLRMMPRTELNLTNSDIVTGDLGTAINCSQCELNIYSSTIMDNNKGISVTDKSIVKIIDSDMFSNIRGIISTKYSNVEISNTSISDSRDTAIYINSGDLKLKDVTLTSSRTCISIGSDGKLVTNNTKLIECDKYGIFVSSGARVESSGSLEIALGGYPFSAGENSYIDLGECVIIGNNKKSYLSKTSVVKSRRCKSTGQLSGINRLPASKVEKEIK